MSSQRIYKCDVCQVGQTDTPEDSRWLRGKATGPDNSKGFAIWPFRYEDAGMGGVSDFCSKKCALEAQSVVLGFATRST